MANRRAVIGEEPARLGVDAGVGRWFVLELTGHHFRLVAGPFQTEAAVERLIDSYKPQAGVDAIITVRSEGTWWDEVALAEEAIEKWKKAAPTDWPSGV